MPPAARAVETAVYFRCTDDTDEHLIYEIQVDYDPDTWQLDEEGIKDYKPLAARAINVEGFRTLTVYRDNGNVWFTVDMAPGDSPETNIPGSIKWLSWIPRWEVKLTETVT